MFLNRKIIPLRKAPQLDAALRQEPVPLLDGGRRTVVSWSAKSACTHVVIWYLHRIGLLDEARRYHPWVHRYRSEVLYKSETHRQARRQLGHERASGWSCVKVVRDPAKRCVSSYRHALKHGYEDEKMSRILGRDISHKTGYSYQTFLDYLGRIDLRNCNIHHRVQRHPLDMISFGRTWLINVDEQCLDAALARLDRIQGSPSVADQPESSEAIAQAANRHAGEGEAMVGGEDIWRTSLSVRDVSQWPKRSLLSSAPASELARQIYECDYDMLSEIAERTEPE